MAIPNTATGERTITGSEPRASDSTALIDVRGVAELLQCSPRTVYRLSENGDMPSPVKLGALVRWDRRRIEYWIAAGCPHQQAKGGGSR
jgi:excisionase family DNA binding protein